MSPARSLIVLLAAIASTSCSRHPADPARVRVEDLSVVWITLDATGARHLGAYGNPLPTSPNIDAFARDGATLFARAYAQSAWTLPSTASFLTGRYARRRKQTSTRVNDETLATVLRRAGLRTAAFSENPYVTSTYGMDRGFDEFHEYSPAAHLHQDSDPYVTDGARVATDAIAWLAATSSQRRFLYLHLLSPHCPYQPPAPFYGRFDPSYTGNVEGLVDTLLSINNGTLDISPRDLEHLRLRYQENLLHADHQVARVIDALRRTGELDRTIVVVTSDHGEAFREHGVLLHTTTLFEEMIHVPLVLRLPPRFGPMPARFDGIVELRDLMPTLCHTMQLDCQVGTTRSLLHALRARRPGPRMARAWTSNAEGMQLGAIVTPERKLIMDATARHLWLFDLARDGGEQHDLAGVELARARRLARRLRAPRTAPRRDAAPTAIDDLTARRLRALGYSD